MNHLHKINFLLLFAFHFSYAQEIVSLENIIEEVKTNNKNIKIAAMQIENEEASAKKINVGFLPQVNLSYSAFATTDPLNTFGFKLQQRVVEASDFNPDLLNNPDNLFNFNTKIALRQPLLNLDVFQMKKALFAQIEATKFQSKRVEQNIIYEAKKAFADLQFLYEAKQVNRQALTTYKENEKVVQNIVNKGLAQKTELLSVQVEIKKIESQNSSIENNIKNLSDYLSYLMGRKNQEIFQPNDKINENLVFVSNTNNLEERADFMAIKKGVEARNFMVKSEQRKYLPKLNAFGEYNFNDRNPLGFQNTGYLVGMQVSWDIFDGNKARYETKQKKIESSIANAELENEMAKNQLEINKLNRELENLRSQIKITEKTIEFNEESLKIKKNRFNQGLEKNVDVLNAETELIINKLNKLELINKQYKTQYQLEYLTTL